MPKKLIVHIGANKTGSTAIQKFLSMNKPALHAEGIIIPDNEFRIANKIQGYHAFGFQKLLQSPLEGRKQLEDAIAALDAAHPRATAILLSAENLAANPAAPSLFEDLVKRYDTKVIIYIRRQDEYILSTWQQWPSKISADFWAWVISVVGMLGDWRAYLKNWETVIPRDKITVRILERSKLEGRDVVADFYSMLGISKPLSTLIYPKGTANPSFSFAIMDLVKGNELIFRNAHDNDFYNFVVRMTGNKYLKNARQSPISILQRRSIMERYKKQNNWVKKNYFPHIDGELFSPPKESDYDYVSPDEISQQKLEFLTTILYLMYKQGQNEYTAT
jgi:Sulfotransferase domain